MREVVTNFLNFARPTQLTVSPVDLRAVADRAADDLRADARALGGDVNVSGEFATIEGDDVLLRQAFSNLLRNAIEACAAARVIPAIRVHAHLDRGSSTCTILVSDNGPGFAEQTRERVFHPFFTTKPQEPDLGSPSCRRSSSPTTGACLPEAVPAEESRSRCPSFPDSNPRRSSATHDQSRAHVKQSSSRYIGRHACTSLSFHARSRRRRGGLPSRSGTVAWRRRQTRRRTAQDVKVPAKVYTNKDLGAAPGIPSDGATPSRTDAAPAASDSATDGAKAGSKGEPAKDQKYWSSRMKTLQAKLERDQVLADAMQTRINGLTTDFVNRDDPAQRAVIAGEQAEGARRAATR